jgi:hypothetical protein
VEEVAACIADASKKGGDSSILGITEDDLKMTIRRQIKAENKSELTDDIYIRAYRQAVSEASNQHSQVAQRLDASIRRYRW